MGSRSDIQNGVKALLLPLIGDADGMFLTVETVTKSDLSKMLNETLPTAPFCLISYAGRDGAREGEAHRYLGRVSVIIGAKNYVSPDETREDVFQLMEAADTILMANDMRIGEGFGPLENTGESLVGFAEDGVEVWEQVYRVYYKWNPTA